MFQKSVPSQMKILLKKKKNDQFKFVTEVFAMKEIKIELLGIAIILLGIVLRANSFFEYFLGVFGFGIVVSGCFLKDKYK